VVTDVMRVEWGPGISACSSASIRDNLQAVAKTIEALRGIDRWGTREMVDAAFQAFAAIPASASAGIQVRPKRPWHGARCSAGCSA
jgi:hypothetical protein